MHRNLLFSALILSSPIQAETLKDVDREALLERLDKLQADADAKIDARFRTAISAYRSALSSDTATLEFYLKCVEKVNFEDQHRRSQDFREWKRRESEKLDQPGLRLALRHQLNWLVLTLEAASSKGDYSSLTPKVQTALRNIFDDIEKLKEGQGPLREGVTGSVFARAYELGGLRVERWPLSPLSIGEIYDQVILPPLRKPSSITSLRTAWNERIRYEGLIMEHWTGNRENQRIGTKESMRSPEYEKFIAETYPDLLWQVEEDCFKSGDQTGSATRMLAHIEKYVTHRKASDWTKAFRKLIDPSSEERPTVTPGPNPTTRP